jgi:hypothetical protein
VSDQVGVMAGRRRRVASSSAHGRHAAGAVCRGQATRARAGARERGRAGFGRGPRSGAAAC